MPQAIGAYQGAVHPDYNSEDWRLALARLPKLLRQAECIADGADAVFRMPCQQLDIAIKVFKRQSVFKDWIDSIKGSKAQRAFQVACHLEHHQIPTPKPIAYFEQWHGRRLIASYLVTQYIADSSNMRDELSQLLWDEPQPEKVHALLAPIAIAVRAMHDSGCQHGDMGNQNILIKRQGPTQWSQVQFMDLNRAKLQSQLSHSQRAFDLARLALPGHLRADFLRMYSQDQPDPDLLQAAKRARSRYAFHGRTHAWRHPIRAWRYRRANVDVRPTYPGDEAVNQRLQANTESDAR